MRYSACSAFQEGFRQFRRYFEDGRLDEVDGFGMVESDTGSVGEPMHPPEVVDIIDFSVGIGRSSKEVIRCQKGRRIDIPDPMQSPDY